MTAIDPWLYPLAAVLLAGIGGFLLLRGLFGRWFRAGGKRGRVRSCRRCRFDLSATQGHTCPECGHTARHEADHYAGRFRWPVAALGGMLLLGAVGVGMTPGIQRDGWLHLLPMGVQVRVFHLEGDAGFRSFVERLDHNAAFRNSSGFGRRPLPRAQPHSESELERFETWQALAVDRSRNILASRSSRQRNIDRAFRILHHFDRSNPDLDILEKIIKARGANSPYVMMSISRLLDANRITTVVADARRELFSNGSDSARHNLVRSLANAPYDERDAELVANFLAFSTYPVLDGRERKVATEFHFTPTDEVWDLYAQYVRRGDFGKPWILSDGIKSSPSVRSAAIEMMISLPVDQFFDFGRRIEVAGAISPSSISEQNWLMLRQRLLRDWRTPVREQLCWVIAAHDPLGAEFFAEQADSAATRDDVHYQIVWLCRSQHQTPRSLAYLETVWADPNIHHYMRAWVLRAYEYELSAFAPNEVDLASRWVELIDLLGSVDNQFERDLIDIALRHEDTVYSTIAMARVLTRSENPPSAVRDRAIAMIHRRWPNVGLEAFARLVLDPPMHRLDAKPMHGRYAEEAASLAKQLSARYQAEPGPSSSVRP